MSSKLARFVAVLAVGLLGAGCGSTEMTDRLEATYAIADFEIEGAERSRTAFKDTIVDGNRGISQFFIADEGVEPQEIFDAAVAAAESDGWVLRQATPRGGVVGSRRIAESEACDVLIVGAPFGGSVPVNLFESECSALGAPPG